MPEPAKSRELSSSGVFAVISGILTYIVGALVALLPTRYRHWWALEGTSDFQAAGWLSGLLESLLAVVILIYRLFAFAVSYQVGMGAKVEGAGMRGESFLALGAAAALDFMLQPVTVLALFLFLEGLVRSFVAFLGDQVLGTLPLAIIAAIHTLYDRVRGRMDLGGLIIDEVWPSDDGRTDLKILSSRPKPHWNPYMTVRFRGEFYQMIREAKGSKPRQFVYYLRKNPAGRSVVVVYEYHPDDVLKPGNEVQRWKPDLP